MSWAASLWLGQRTHLGNPVIFTATFAGKMSLPWHMEYRKSCATTRGPSTFHEINVFVWKLRVGGCLVSKATPSESKRLSGSRSGFWRLHKWWGIENIPFQKTWLWTLRVQSTSVFPCLQRFLLRLKRCVSEGATKWSIHQLWSQFTMIVGQVIVDATWSRDEMLVGGFLLPYYTWSFRLFDVDLLLVNHPEWHVPPHFEQVVHLGKDAWLFWHRFCWARRAHLGVHSVLGQQPVLSGLRVISGFVQQQNKWSGAGTTASFVRSACQSWIGSAAT